MIEAEWFSQRGLKEKDVNAVNPEGDCALILASRAGDADLISELIEKGADISAVDAYGNNAIWAAC